MKRTGRSCARFFATLAAAAWALAAQAQDADPTASLMSFQLTDIYTASFHGLDYGQVVSALGHKWRPNAEAGYEFRDLAGNPTWTIRAGVTLLLPKN